MKLFLGGGGSGEQTALAMNTFGKIIDKNKPLLYIPLAMKPEKYPRCLEWIKKETENLNVCDIEMVTSFEEVKEKNFDDYCALFIGGGNTYKLLYELKNHNCLDKIKTFAINGGIVFGGSAGAMIFGESIDTCKYEDENKVGLVDTTAMNLLGGYSILAHYTSGDEEKTRISTEFLIELSMGKKIIGIPEEDTIFVNDEKVEVIGTRPYYIFENGLVKKVEVTEETKIRVK